MNIEIETLRRVSEMIFDHMDRDLGLKSVSLDSDYYWAVPDEEVYSVDKDPPKLDIGRLTDDLSFLEALLEDRDQAASLMFLHLAPLLRYLALKIGQ